MSRINNDLPNVVLVAVAQGCGFGISFDRSPGVNKWTLSRGHGATYVEHTGTKEDVCAFLAGYATMMLQTTQILNELDCASHELVDVMRARITKADGSHG